MALSGATVTNFPLEDRKLVVRDITFDSSYPTGGEAVVPADFSLSVIDFLIVGQAGGYVIEHDATNKKLKVYRQKDPGAVGGADIALVEVANATNLATLVVRVVAIGH